MEHALVNAIQVYQAYEFFFWGGVHMLPLPLQRWQRWESGCVGQQIQLNWLCIFNIKENQCQYCSLYNA